MIPLCGYNLIMVFFFLFFFSSSIVEEICRELPAFPDFPPAFGRDGEIIEREQLKTRGGVWLSWCCPVFHAFSLSFPGLLWRKEEGKEMKGVISSFYPKA